MAFSATQSVTGRRQSGSAYTRTPAHWAGQEFRSGKSLGRVVGKPYLGITSRLPVIRPNGPSVEGGRAEHQAGSSTYAIAPTPTGRRIRPLRWNNGQDNLRGMLCVQVDCVVGDLRAAVVVERFSGVGVDVEAGEVAA